MFVDATRQLQSPERRHSVVDSGETCHLLLVIPFVCLRLFLFGMDVCFCFFPFDLGLVVHLICVCLILTGLDLCFCLFLFGIDVCFWLFLFNLVLLVVPICVVQLQLRPTVL